MSKQSQKSLLYNYNTRALPEQENTLFMSISKPASHTPQASQHVLLEKKISLLQYLENFGKQCTERLSSGSLESRTNCSPDVISLIVSQITLGACLPVTDIERSPCSCASSLTIPNDNERELLLSSPPNICRKLMITRLRICKHTQPYLHRNIP